MAREHERGRSLRCVSVHACGACARRQRLEFLDPPLLSQALLALSQLREVPGAALSQAMGSQLSNKLPMFDDRELASVAQVSSGGARRAAQGQGCSLLGKSSPRSPR